MTRVPDILNRHKVTKVCIPLVCLQRHRLFRYLHHTVEDWAVSLPKQSRQDSRMNMGQVAVSTVLERMIHALVDQPEAVSIEAVEHETSILFLVSVAPADRGKVIGREGRTARSLRILLSAIGMKSGTSFG